MFQLSGDLEDLEQALKKPQHLRKPMFSRESCSALVKPTSDNKDILFAHVTWSTYQTMLRIQKLYKFAYATISNSNGWESANFSSILSFFGYFSGSEMVPSQTITFSSYPGTLLSIDDFYLLESGLVGFLTHTSL